MRSRPTLWLAWLLACAASAAPADAQPAPWSAPLPARPLADGTYQVAGALLRDYVACAVEVRLVRGQASTAAALVAEMEAASAAGEGERAALRTALADTDLALELCDGRRAVLSAEAEAQRAEAARARRSAGRWRAVAVVSGGAAVALGALRLLDL